jgi:hypothetical protein
LILFDSRLLPHASSLFLAGKGVILQEDLGIGGAKEHETNLFD